MKDLYKSISLDDGRVAVIELAGDKYAITKKTSIKEVQNMEAVHNHLQEAKLFEWLNIYFKIVVPKVISWNAVDETINLEFKDGKNLEELLSIVDENRPAIIDFTQKLLTWIKETGTFWRGLAPRHIVLDTNNNEVTILDFERPVMLKNGGFFESEFNDKLRGLVHEEFSAFLFEDEQQKIFPDIWKDENYKEEIDLEAIHGKRIKLLLNNFFGLHEKKTSREELYFVYRFMSYMVTPYLIDGKEFFPLKAIDKKVRGAENYVNTVLTLMTMDKNKWPKYLEYEIN